MKIGIVTFHHAHNYGAVLQCFALKKVIEKMGHDVEIINHINPKIKSAYDFWPMSLSSLSIFHKIKRICYRSLFNLIKIRRIRLFDSFIINHLGVDREQNEDWNGFDAIVWGSDQIWNTGITGDDEIYWGNVECGKAKRISYAASSGIIRADFAEKVKFLNSFDVIGVREQNLFNELKTYNINSTVNLDPTLLLTAEDWEKMLPIGRNLDGDYLLVYYMRDRKRTEHFAKRVAKKLNLKIVEIHNSTQFNNLIYRYSSASPLDFLRLFRHAKFVVTDSFHGTAFSVIFNRPFYSLKLEQGSDVRAASLLDSLELSDCFVIPESVDEINSVVDFTQTNSHKTEIVNNSLEYLKSNLQ